jgi:hypothetical protein
LNAVRIAADHIDRLEAALAEFVPNWTMAPVVAAFRAMRGVQFVTAVTMLSEVGDLRRFDHLRQLMAFLGLVPSERSAGDKRRQAGIIKAGNTGAQGARGSRVDVSTFRWYRRAASPAATGTTRTEPGDRLESTGLPTPLREGHLGEGNSILIDKRSLPDRRESPDRSFPFWLTYVAR